MILSTILSLCLSSAFGAPAKPDVSFDNARAYLPMTGARATAGYVDLKNSSSVEAKVSVVSADGFKAAEMHETFETAGKMRMRKIENLTLKKQGSDKLEPGGKHIMLFDPIREFKEGESVELTLKVNDTTRKVSFKMVPRVSKEKSEHEHHH